MSTFDLLWIIEAGQIPRILYWAPKSVYVVTFLNGTSNLSCFSPDNLQLFFKIIPWNEFLFLRIHDKLFLSNKKTQHNKLVRLHIKQFIMQLFLSCKTKNQNVCPYIHIPVCNGSFFRIVSWRSYNPWFRHTKPSWNYLSILRLSWDSYQRPNFPLFPSSGVRIYNFLSSLQLRCWAGHPTP